MEQRDVSGKVKEHSTFLKNVNKFKSKNAQEIIKNKEPNKDVRSSTISDKNEFSDNEKLIALTSFPGSGNTWLR